jgi:hypothetical protein
MGLGCRHSRRFRHRQLVLRQHNLMNRKAQKPAQKEVLNLPLKELTLSIKRHK